MTFPLNGPTGIGTTALQLTGSTRLERPREMPVRPIPGLRYRPAVEPDPELVADIEARTRAWARGLDLYPPEWEADADGFATAYATCLYHPDHASRDHLLAASRMLFAENVVDDCYCEDRGGSPRGLGARLLIAQSAVDHLHATREYEEQWRTGLTADAPLRSYHSAMEYVVGLGTAAQADRLRNDLGRLHAGYLCEAAWCIDETTPPVWQYLAMRQFNNFRPCLTLTDLVAGYELPAELQTTAAVQRATALACNVATICNDLYSYTKEFRGSHWHINLPVVIARSESLPARAAYLKAIEIHNEMMDGFEAQAATIIATWPDPRLARYLTGLASWVAGNHHWHSTNRYRYTLPDYWS
ncbi:2-methylisoborneol synthase [Kitasatospora sp. MMS16-BH015]|uniref:terpene synthase family protein n=1 Tax=Kitasatospora sp. MMS16-BH015 TaxID=2018025 RepID=UPI000CA1E143|nr:2-methylisoborneol synthase [Kitasatospora sp. MMS16-BH015]AUG81577.1 2-methylisoborneol synthase [Kitasatospora sp. MMS16-BH015]